MKRKGGFALIIATAAIIAVTAITLVPDRAGGQERRTLYWGTSGSDVTLVQRTLRDWGYYDGPVTGYYGALTFGAITRFQRSAGIFADGVVGRSTWEALGYPQITATVASWGGGSVWARGDELDLLARTITGEAQGEPYEGQVAVAAVILNRVRHPSFPNSLAGVIYEPWAFESVSNGLIWARSPSAAAYNAASDAMNGWDPTYGAIYFWNPATATSPWVWTRSIIRDIGRHVFAR